MSAASDYGVALVEKYIVPLFDTFDANEPEVAAGDVIAHLLHWVDFQGLGKPEVALEIGQRHWLAERGDGDDLANDPWYQGPIEDLKAKPDVNQEDMMTQFQCDTCGKVGTEDDLCADGEECPDSDCTGHTWRLGTFEVTVPLVIRVKREAHDVVEVIDWTIDPGFGDFHSEAQEAGGVWDPEMDAWVRDDDLAGAAHEFVNRSLGASKPIPTTTKETA